MVVLSLSSVPEETCSQVYDKNMHTLLACSGPIFFLLIILYFFSDSSSSFFQFLSLASASIVYVFYILEAYFSAHDFVSIGQKRIG